MSFNSAVMNSKNSTDSRKRAPAGVRAEHLGAVAQAVGPLDEQPVALGDGLVPDVVGHVVVVAPGAGLAAPGDQADLGQ